LETSPGKEESGIKPHPPINEANCCICTVPTMLSNLQARLSSKGGSSDEEPARRMSLNTEEMSKNLTKTYGTLNAEEQGILMQDGLFNSYDVNALTTWRAFFVVKGTILLSRELWMETLLNALVYWCVFAFCMNLHWKNFGDFVGKESTIRAFIAMFSTLIGLLLAFYTGLNLERWWKMREGVQDMQEASKELSMMIFSGVTSDAGLHDTIHRYVRASLFLIFAASNFQEGDHPPRHRAVENGLLTAEEVEKLELCNKHMSFVHAETLWVWLARAVAQLHDQGLTKGVPHYCALMSVIERGRSGVANIQGFLETPVPMGYVHLLCLMVKLHNVFINILMAMLTVKVVHSAKEGGSVAIFRFAFRAFFMPFLYNALLILNAQVADPFDGSDEADFNYNYHDINMLASTKSYYTASMLPPACLADKIYKPIGAEVLDVNDLP